MNNFLNALNEDEVHVLKKNPLFFGIDFADFNALLSCLNAQKKEYDKNTFIMSEGGKTRQMGLVLSGSAHILQEDFWGNRSILAVVESGEIFAEAFMAADLKRLPVSVLAAAKAVIITLDSDKVTSACSYSCGFHITLIRNIVRILAQKNVILTQKATLLSRRSTREKLLSYLSNMAKVSKKDTFSIALNRQQLADFLSVDRSAMSAELSKMQAEGILSYHLNTFKLLKK